jgi:hypothetical protein
LPGGRAGELPEIGRRLRRVLKCLATSLKYARSFAAKTNQDFTADGLDCISPDPFTLSDGYAIAEFNADRSCYTIRWSNSTDHEPEHGSSSANSKHICLPRLRREV